MCDSEKPLKVTLVLLLFTTAATLLTLIWCWPGPQEVEQLEAVAQTHKATEAANADQRLSWPMRIVLFFFCSGIFGALLAVYYDSKGFKGKASDCWFTMGVSVAFHALMGILLALI